MDNSGIAHIIGEPNKQNSKEKAVILSEAKEINKKAITQDEKLKRCKEKAKAFVSAFGYELNVMINECEEVFK